MRNLKKALALIITLSLALSFVSISVAAADVSYNKLENEYALKFAPPLKTGEVEYPIILNEDAIGYMPKFEDGDRIAFIGDSISHGTMGAYYYKQIFAYYATRYPDMRISYVNKGFNGATVKTTLTRMKFDVLDTEFEKPYNKAVIMLGTNDMQRAEYFEGKEKEDGAFDRRQKIFNDYYADYTKFVTQLKDAGIEKIYINSSPLFDHWLPYREDASGYKAGGVGTGYSSNPMSVDFNNIIRKGGSIAYNIAVNNNAQFVDFNTPQTIIQYFNRFYKNDKVFTFNHDRIHPYEELHYVLAYTFLKAQGETGEVATVSINAADNSMNVSNATVTDLKASNSEVSYTYKANALPMAADEFYRKAELVLPITDELNREIIKVSGLKDGVYNIKIDGESVVRATAEELAQGVNIADKAKNPGQMQALTIFGLAEARRNLDTAHRDFIQNSESPYISKYKLDATSNQTLIDSAKAWIEKNPTNASGVEALTAFIEYKTNEKKTIETINSYEDLIYSINKPTEHKVEIVKSSLKSSNNSIIPKYIDYKIPEPIYDIKKLRVEGDISVYVDGEELVTDVKPTVIDGRTLVPLRAIFEEFGANISWDEASATATAKVGSKVIKLTENNKTSYVDNEVVELDVPAQIIDGRFVVPVRFVSETLGATVLWDDWEQDVLILSE